MELVVEATPVFQNCKEFEKTRRSKAKVFHENRVTRKGRVMSNEEFKEYAERRGLCTICGECKTHKKSFFGNKLEPLTVTNSEGVISVYKGCCIGPTCYPSVEFAKGLLGETHIVTAKVISRTHDDQAAVAVEGLEEAQKPPTAQHTGNQHNVNVPPENQANWRSRGHESLGRGSAEAHERVVAADMATQISHNKNHAIVAVTQNGHMLKQLKMFNGDKEVVLAAVKNAGIALRYAGYKDRDVVHAAVSQNGAALLYAGTKWNFDEKIVLAAVQQDGLALAHASLSCQWNRDIVLAAVKNKGMALQFTHDALKDDKEIVMAAVSENGNALSFASERLQADKELICAAVAKKPEALKYAIQGLNQDRDCWIAAGLLNEDQQTVNKERFDHAMKVVLSTKFSLHATSSSTATAFTSVLQQNPLFKNLNVVVYSPNAYNKSTCDPEWTRMDWPCRGTYDTCKKEAALKTGTPEAASCWRYSYRCQLEEAKRTDGFMIQVVDLAGEPSLYETKESDYQLGDGQKIEVVMAEEVGAKVFRVYRPRIVNGKNGQYLRDFQDGHISTLFSHIKKWRDGNCTDTSVCEIDLTRRT